MLNTLKNPFRSGKPEDKEDPLKKAAEENRILKEILTELTTSRDESTRSLKQEQEDKAAVQQSLRQAEDEKRGALSQNQQLAKVLDDLRRQLDGKSAELRKLQNELQRSQRPGHDGESPNEAADENQKPKEREPRLRESHQNSVDDSSTALSPHRRLMEELETFRCQLGSKGAEFKDLQNELLRLQKLGDEGESLKGAAAENRLLKEQLARLRASHRKTTDEFTALSHSYQREQEDKAAVQQTLRREKDGKSRALLRNEQLTGERDDLVRQLESNDVELTNLRNALQRKDESYKKGAEDNWKLREEIVQLEASYWRAIDESTILSQSLKREQEDKVAAQRSLLQEAHEKAGVVSRNGKLTRELEGLSRQLESNDVEVRNLRNALQREEQSSKGGAEENRRLGEEIGQLKASYQRAADESTSLSRLLKQEQEAKKVIVQSLNRREAERVGALSQNEELTGVLDGLNDRLESNGAELTNIRSTLRHQEESLRGTEEVNRKLNEEIVRLEASCRKAVDESIALSQLLKREQEDKAEVLRSLRQREDDNGRALSQKEGLTVEVEDLRYRLQSNEIKLMGLQNALEFEKESHQRAAEENLKLKEDVVELRASHQRAVDKSTSLSLSLKREQEGKAATLRSVGRWDENGRAPSQNDRPTEERNSSKHQLNSNNVELDGLRRQLESKDIELRNVRGELRQEKASLKGAVEESWKLAEEVAKLKASHRKAVDESAALSQSLKREREGKAAMPMTGGLGGSRHQLEGKDAEVNNLRSALQQSQTKHDELAVLLEARSRELKSAQVYLTTADTLSGAEVIALVDALNVEILQTSAFISDSFDYARESAHPNNTKAASARITEFIGSTLANLVSTAPHSDNNLLVQIALQSAAVELSRQIILTWDLGDLQTKQPLAKLYSDIREAGQVRSLKRVTHTDDRAETQAVGGRWRALTRAHAQKVALWEGNPHATMVGRISDTLVAILVAARCTKSYEDTRRIFADKFGEHISGIVKMALRLNKAMGEEVTSADLRPVNATSGEKFDAATMANFESRGENLKGQFVLCTTALGMERSEKVQGDVVELKTTILLKPKVAVESVVDALDGMTR